MTSHDRARPHLHVHIYMYIVYNVFSNMCADERTHCRVVGHLCVQWWPNVTNYLSIYMQYVLTYNASAFRHRRQYVFRPEIPFSHLYMGPLVHPTNRDRFSACPSVRPSVRPNRLPGISRRTHGWNSLTFCMLMYPDHLQNWLDFGHGLLIFLFLASLWLSETGQICGFRAFRKERMDEMAWNFTRWCILTTVSTGKIMVTVCWFF